MLSRGEHLEKLSDFIGFLWQPHPVSVFYEVIKR